MDLGGLPTPLEDAPPLAEALGLGSLLIKRDDSAGSVYGGSKARKLEHLLAEARRSGQQTIVTFGGVGSNHALATAVHTQRQGFECVLGLLPERPSAHAREHLLAEHHLGCEQLPARGGAAETLLRLRARPEHADGFYDIPIGGTSPLGNAGYVNGALELAAQLERARLPAPERIYVAGGTMGTAAGLYVGLRAAELETVLVVVRASNPATGSMGNLRNQILRTSRFLHELDEHFPLIDIDPSLLRLEHGFAGPGYALPTSAGAAAIELAAERGSLTLDGTYTGKAFAALRANAPHLGTGSVLFWNTYDPRHISWGDSTARDLPSAFRGYFPR